MLIRPTKYLFNSGSWRFFATGTKIKSGMSEEFGQGAINDDEFLPNQEEIELKIK